jgi:hypothetical protein
MQTFYITPPDVCSLAYSENNIVYTQYYDGPIEVPDEATVEQFLTPDDALVRAKEIDPNYDANNILGALNAQVISSSDPNPVVFKNEDVTMSCQVECEGLPITYTWTGPDGAVIPGATTDTYTILQAKETDAGRYTCTGSAENAKGQTGTAEVTFTLTVLNNQGSGIG